MGALYADPLSYAVDAFFGHGLTVSMRGVVLVKIDLSCWSFSYGGLLQCTRPRWGYLRRNFKGLAHGSALNLSRILSLCCVHTALIGRNAGHGLNYGLLFIPIPFAFLHLHTDARIQIIRILLLLIHRLGLFEFIFVKPLLLDVK